MADDKQPFKPGIVFGEQKVRSKVADRPGMEGSDPAVLECLAILKEQGVAAAECDAIIKALLEADAELQAQILACLATLKEQGALQQECLETIKDILSECDKYPETWKIQKHYFGLENTKTRFNREYVVQITLQNGEVRTVTLPAGTGWLNQMQNWETALAAAFSEACEVANHWWEWREAFLPNQGNGAIPPADMAFPAAFGQFIQFEYCPTDTALMPVGADIISVNGEPVKSPIPLIVATDISKVEYVVVCRSCDPECNETPPKCAIPAGDTFPELPEPACTTVSYDLCDKLEDDTLVPFVAFVTDCDGERTTETYSLDEEGNLEPYEIQGQIVDCDSGEPFVFPEPECELSDFAETCPTGETIPDANYNGAIAWVTGRPNTGVPWQLIDNRDPNNQVVVFEGADFAEFIANAETAGYTEWSFGETHYFCPCPPGLVNAGDYFVTADGNTVSKPACQPLAEVPEAPEKVQPEDKKFLRTLGKNDDRRDDLLEQIRDLLTCPATGCPEIDIGDITQFDGDGNPLPFSIMFPYQTDPAQVQDFVIPFSLTDPQGCLANADQSTLIRTRFYFRCHDLVNGSNSTTGFNVVLSGTGTFVAESPSNTLDNTSPTNNFGTQTAGVGVLDNASRDKADRWVEYDIPLGELLAGQTLTTSAFGGFPTGVTEELGGVYIYTPTTDWAALGCEGC